jgi:hypothetical protein
MKTIASTKTNELKQRLRAPVDTPTDLTAEATRDIAGAMNAILADVFALYLKTKNFHWHLSGPHFRDYHLMFDEHAEQVFAMTDPIAERIRKIGGSTLKSIGQISRCSASWTTMPSTSIRRTCWPSYSKTIRCWRRVYVSLTMSATGTAIWPQPASSRRGSMKRNDAPGSFLSPAGDSVETLAPT